MARVGAALALAVLWLAAACLAALVGGSAAAPELSTELSAASLAVAAELSAASLAPALDPLGGARFAGGTDALVAAVHEAYQMVTRDPIEGARLLGGDFSQVNTILSKVQLDLNISAIDPIYLPTAKQIPLFAGGYIPITLFFIFWEPGNAAAKCSNISIGSVDVLGSKNPIKQILYDTELCLMDGSCSPGLSFVKPRLVEQYFMELLVTGIKMQCDIPTRVVHNCDFSLLSICDGTGTAAITKAEVLQVARTKRPTGNIKITALIDLDIPLQVLSLANFSTTDASKAASVGAPPRDCSKAWNGTAPSSAPTTTPALAYVDCQVHRDTKQVVMFRNLTFSVSGLGTVTNPSNILGGDETLIGKGGLSAEVELQLGGEKKSLAQDPIEKVLYDLLNGMQDQVRPLLDRNMFTDNSTVGRSSNFAYYFLQVRGAKRVVPSKALSYESSVLAKAPAGVKLSNLGDNMLVNAVKAFPDDSMWVSGDDPSPNASVFKRVYPFLSGNVTVPAGVDPILGVVDNYLKTNLSATRGVLNRTDVFKTVEEVLGASTLNASVGVPFNFDFAFVNNKTAVVVNVTATHAYLWVAPRSDAPANPRTWLDRIYLLGNQTLRLPALEGLDVKVEVRLTVKVQFLGGDKLMTADMDKTGTLYKVLDAAKAFNISEPEIVVTAEWLDFFLELTGAVAVDEEAVPRLQIGPLAEHLLDCAVSLFYTTPRITGAVTNARGSSLVVSGFTDGIVSLVGVAVNAIYPLYEGLIPGLAEYVMATALVEAELLKPRVCPEAVNTGDAIFQFNGTLLDQVHALLTQDNVYTLINTLFPKSTEYGRQEFNQVVTADKPARVVTLRNLPSTDGLNIDVELLISSVEIAGVSPGNFTSFILLDVPKDNPTRIFNDIAVGSLGRPVVLSGVLEFNTYPTAKAPPGPGRRLAQENEDEDEDEDENEELQQEQVQGEHRLRELVGTATPTGFPTTSRPSLPTTLEPTSKPTTLTPTPAPTTRKPTRRPTSTPPTPFPVGTQLNKLRLTVSFESVHFLLDLILKFKAYDVMSTQVRDVLKLWCWMGKLQKPSGLQEIALQFTKGLMRLECETCMNTVLAGLAARFNNDAASIEFFAFLNLILDYVATALENFFKGTTWDTTITDLQRMCQELDPLPNVQTFGKNKEEMGSLMVLLGAATASLAVMASVQCCCMSSTHEVKRHARLAPGAGAGAGAARGSLSKGGGAAESSNPLAFLEDVEDKGHVAERIERTPMFNHPDVSTCWKFGIPLLLVLNLALFIVGHLGVAVTTSLFAGFAGAPIELKDFQGISVIKSASAVWNAGGIFLALLIILLSITWPYVKIVGMAICWFTPTRALSFHGRGTLIRRLDQLGKWSLVELYLLLFILVTFRLEVASPETTFLPKNFYALALSINPQLSIYTFCTALVISLATSNVIEWLHEGLEKKAATVNRKPQKGDEEPIAMADFTFPTPAGDSAVGISRLGTALLVAGIAVAVTLKFVAAISPSLSTQIVGLAGLVIELENKGSSFQVYSLFRFLTLVLGSVSPGQVYLGAFFLLTVIAIPVLQLILLIKLLLGRHTLNQAVWWYDVNVVLSAWACSEVFLMGVGVTVMEMGQISGSLVAKECAFLQPFMKNQLLPLGLIGEADVNASCFQLLGTIEYGLYVLFLSIIIANICHYTVTVAFLKFVQARLDIQEGQRTPGPAINALEKFYLATGLMRRGTAVARVAV